MWTEFFNSKEDAQARKLVVQKVSHRLPCGTSSRRWQGLVKQQPFGWSVTIHRIDNWEGVKGLFEGGA